MKSCGKKEKIEGILIMINGNDSEDILSAFSKLYFFDELVHDHLRFTPMGSTEKEVADLLLNLGDIIVVIQLKWRNNVHISSDEVEEIKWLGKKCKEAKKQVKESIKYIHDGNLPPFENGKKQKIKLNAEAKIIPLVIFMNKRIDKYEHIIQKHSDEGLNVNCFSYEDFKKMSEILVTPIEIVNYIEWRQKFFEDNGSVDFMIYEADDGTISFTKPNKNESLVYQFLSENYGIQKANELAVDTQMFREFLHRLPEHTVMRSQENSDCEIIKFFAHFDRIEIHQFNEKLELSIREAQNQNKEYTLVGSLRNVLRAYAIVFVSSKYGKSIPMEILYQGTLKKSEVKILLQIIVYWENNTDYRVDFCYCSFGEN